MADIELTLGGDASGAVGALNETGQATGELAKASERAWKDIASAAKVAGAAVAAFGTHALKSYADSERIQRQLTRAAGEYGEALGEQAQALSKLYAIDDDVIKQSQTLLVQWGGVGAATKETTEAILDYASATGTDAVAATQALIRNVESGGVGLAKMGIHFDATGNKGKDLVSAVEAINGRLGGAAAADANSLSGQAAAASVALGDLEKGFGELIAAMVQKGGVIGVVRDALATYQELFFGDAQQQKNTAYLAMQTKIAQLYDDRAGMEKAEQHNLSIGNDRQAAYLRSRKDGIDAEIEKLKELRDAKNAAISGSLPGAGSVSGATSKGLKDATTKPGRTDEDRLADAKKYYDGMETLSATAAQQEQDQFADSLEAEARRVADSIKIREDGQKAYDAIRLSEEKKTAEHAEKLAKDTAKAEENALKDQQARVAKKEKEAQAAGDAIGAAMVNALADQLSKLAEGGEFDAALFVGDILAAAVGVAGGIIGTAFGAPAVGAAIGNLAAMGIRAGASGISRANKKNTYHDGGWVGAPRYHDGSWIAPDEQRAVLQSGERVLSRQEVRNAGGPGAVDGMAKGGRSVTLNITAIDAKSMADTFAGEGGNGLKQALRRGQGALPALLGRGPR